MRSEIGDLSHDAGDEALLGEHVNDRVLIMDGKAPEVGQCPAEDWLLDQGRVIQGLRVRWIHRRWL